MTESNIIEIGSDGCFDISAPPPPTAARPVKPVPIIDTKAEWARNKQSGNKAFSDGNYDLAIEYYTRSLDVIVRKLEEIDLEVNGKEQPKTSHFEADDRADLTEREKLAAEASRAAAGAAPIVKESSAVLRTTRVALYANRALCHLKRAEAAVVFEEGMRHGGGSGASFAFNAAARPSWSTDEPPPAPPAPALTKSTTASCTAGAGDAMAGFLGGAAAYEAWSECAADCTRALESDPANAKALHRLSRAMHALGRPHEALRHARHASRTLLSGSPAQPASAAAGKRAAGGATSAMGREVQGWCAWLRALEAEREAAAAARHAAFRSLNRGDGSGGGSGAQAKGDGGQGVGFAGGADGACLEAAAAYLHVLGPTATHTNETAATAADRGGSAGPGGRWHWRRGPRNATEGALYAAARAVALALHAKRGPQAWRFAR